MISSLDITDGFDIEVARHSLRVIVWCERDDRVVQAYACDTQSELKSVVDLLNDMGDVYHTVEHVV